MKSSNQTDRIPLTRARLEGDTVHDLVEALQTLDQDAKVNVSAVKQCDGRYAGGGGQRYIIFEITGR